MDRREFLKKSMLLTAGALIGGSLFSETSAAKGAKQNGIPRKKKSIGLQLYSIGGDMSADAAQALRQISEMGYSTAETASYGDGKFYGRTPAEFRKMAEDLGIAVTGAHIARELDKNDMQGCMDWWKQACDLPGSVGKLPVSFPVTLRVQGGIRNSKHHVRVQAVKTGVPFEQRRIGENGPFG